MRIAALLLVLAPAAAAEDLRPASWVLAREGPAVLERVGGQRVLRVRGTPREMGLQHGRLVAREVAATVRAYLDEWAIAKAGETRASLRRIWEAHRPHVPARYHEELAGLAEGSGVALGELELFHAIPTRFHCSGAAASGAATADGRLYHTRSLDYALDIGASSVAQEHALLLVHQPPDAPATATLAWAGFVGCVSGMNDAGISVGEMGSRSDDETWDGLPMVFLVREALRERTLDGALRAFRGAPRTCGFNFIVADGRARAAAAVEMNRSRVAVFRAGDAAEDVAPHRALPDVVRRTNHFVDPALAATQRADYDPRRGAPGSWDGYEKITAFLERERGRLDPAAMVRLLRTYPPGHPCLHQAVFAPSEDALWVSHAADPRRVKRAGAQNGDFYRYDLAALVRGAPAGRGLRIERGPRWTNGTLGG
jgi:predicted choloylglycine hydrolase